MAARTMHTIESMVDQLKNEGNLGKAAHGSKD